MSVGTFKFWCQKVLPAVYDDSLSYYELLCKVVAKLNEVINSTNMTAEGFNTLKNYVDTYFDDLNIQNEVNNKLDAMAESGELGDIISTLGGDFTVVGGTNTYYVDGATGSDENDGRTTTTAFMTLSRALREMNRGVNAQYSIYLIGDRIYEIDSNIYVIWQGTPHFYAMNGSPTIKFTYATGAGPRFYSCHINMTGDANNRLKVDSSAGGVYFEGCSCGFSHVDFLVPIRFLGGSARCGECSFTTVAGKSPSWGFKYRPCITANGCAVRLENVSFNCSDGLSTGIWMTDGCSANILGTLSTVENVQPCVDNSIIFVDSSFVKLTPTFLRGDTTNPYKWTVRANAACIICTSQTAYDEWEDNGLYLNNSSMLIDNNVIKNAYFVAGKTVNLGYTSINGYINGNGDGVVGVVVLPEKPIGVTNLTVSCSKLTIRAPKTKDSGMVGVVLADTSSPNTFGTFEVVGFSDYTALIRYTFDDELLGVNYTNSPVNIYMEGATIRAS